MADCNIDNKSYVHMHDICPSNLSTDETNVYQTLPDENTDCSSNEKDTHLYNTCSNHILTDNGKHYQTTPERKINLFGSKTFTDVHKLSPQNRSLNQEENNYNYPTLENYCNSKLHLQLSTPTAQTSVTFYRRRDFILPV